MRRYYKSYHYTSSSYSSLCQNVTQSSRPRPPAHRPVAGAPAGCRVTAQVGPGYVTDSRAGICRFPRRHRRLANDAELMNWHAPRNSRMEWPTCHRWLDASPATVLHRSTLHGRTQLKWWRNNRPPAHYDNETWWHKLNATVTMNPISVWTKCRPTGNSSSRTHLSLVHWSLSVPSLCYYVHGYFYVCMFYFLMGFCKCSYSAWLPCSPMFLLRFYCLRSRMLNKLIN